MVWDCLIVGLLGYITHSLQLMSLMATIAIGKVEKLVLPGTSYIFSSGIVVDMFSPQTLLIYTIFVFFSVLLGVKLSGLLLKFVVSIDIIVPKFLFFILQLSFV
jgi:hypothetical protein